MSCYRSDAYQNWFRKCFHHYCEREGIFSIVIYVRFDFIFLLCLSNTQKLSSSRYLLCNPKAFQAIFNQKCKVQIKAVCAFVACGLIVSVSRISGISGFSSALPLTRERFLPLSALRQPHVRFWLPSLCLCIHYFHGWKSYSFRNSQTTNVCFLKKKKNSPWSLKSRSNHFVAGDLFVVTCRKAPRVRNLHNHVNTSNERFPRLSQNVDDTKSLMTRLWRRFLWAAVVRWRKWAQKRPKSSLNVIWNAVEIKPDSRLGPFQFFSLARIFACKRQVFFQTRAEWREIIHERCLDSDESEGGAKSRIARSAKYSCG